MTPPIKHALVALKGSKIYLKDHYSTTKKIFVFESFKKQYSLVRRGWDPSRFYVFLIFPRQVNFRSLTFDNC